MLRFVQYYGRYQSLRGGLGTMPGWARVMIALAALPGLLLALLSLLALAVSILALLLLTVPTYRLVQWLTGEPTSPMGRPASQDVIDAEVVERPKRQIDVRIVRDENE